MLVALAFPSDPPIWLVAEPEEQPGGQHCLPVHIQVHPKSCWMEKEIASCSNCFPLGSLWKSTARGACAQQQTVLTIHQLQQAW